MRERERERERERIGSRTNIISDTSLASVDGLVVVAVLVRWIACSDTHVVGA